MNFEKVVHKNKTNERKNMKRGVRYARVVV